jgi:hypothetical protein
MGRIFQLSKVLHPVGVDTYYGYNKKNNWRFQLSKVLHPVGVGTFAG